ncbi:MAG TPA: tetratricopeptide repeat protein [Candidatus Angelobacter sp.]|jgi:tetratricopeptide (TPR) repeat protein|nr:tetratricopeptide repeat protein [Candidatus Angelobacter sp.]
MAPHWESRLQHSGWTVILAAGAFLLVPYALLAQDTPPAAPPGPSAQTPSTPTAVAPQPAAAPTPQEQPAPLVPIATASVQELEHQGDVLRAQKRYLDAIDYYDAALAKQPTPLLWNKKGMAELFLERNKEAKQSFERAVKLDKDCAEGLNNIGYMALIEKRYNRAIQYYEKALVIRPNSATFHYNMGAALFAKHQFDKATVEYRTAFQIDPGIFLHVSKVGIIVRSASPADRAAFAFMVAKMYAQAGDFDNSLVYLRKAMEDGYKNIDSVYKDNEFASLRTDPRFTELMAQKPQAIQ